MIAQLQTIGAWAALGLLLAACMGASYLYSGLETGIYVLNKIRLELRAEAGQKRARQLRKLLGNHTNFLAVILIGNNLANYTLSFTVSAMFALVGLADRAELYTMAIVTPLLFVLCESLPKNVFQRSAESQVYRFSPLLWGSSKLFNAIGVAPAVRAFSHGLTLLAGTKARRYSPMAHESAAAAVAEGYAVGALTHFQSIMADRVMHLEDLAVRDVALPLAQAVTVSQGASRDEIVQAVKANPYARMPVIGPTGQVVGILEAFELLAAPADRPVSDFILPPLMIEESAGIVQAIYRMRRQAGAMAISVGPDGRHKAILTFKDLVEEIVGELDAW